MSDDGGRNSTNDGDQGDLGGRDGDDAAGAFTVVRTFDAPPERVFAAWTEPEHLGWFFSGHGEVTEPIVADATVGGAWRQRMIVDDDTSYVTGGIYRELVPGERLVFDWGAVGGWPELPVDASTRDAVDVPRVTITLIPLPGDRTELRLHQALPSHLTDEQRAEWDKIDCYAGWSQTIDRLPASL